MFLALLLACSEYGLTDQSPSGVIDTPVEHSSDTAELVAYVEDPATEPIYLNTSTELYSWSDNLSLIGTFTEDGQAVSGMTDIAIDFHGRMYGITATTLYQIDPQTAEIEKKTNLSKKYNGLTCLFDGTLIAAGDTLDILDETADYALTFFPEGLLTTSGDIIMLPDGLLYWSVKEPNQPDRIAVVDPIHGSLVRINNVMISGIYGLAYSDDNLYGFTSNKEVIVIDQESGEIKETHSLLAQWWGATTNPMRWQK